MRKKIIIGNWKMNKNGYEATTYCHLLEELTQNIEGVEFGVAPNILCLRNLLHSNFPFIIAAQDCFYEKSGPFTGETSYKMLKDIGIKYCIVGHSERRALFNETNRSINRKIIELLKNNMTPIFCIGDTKLQKENGEALEVITNQLIEGLKGVAPGDIKNIVIAYEPVWAIGTNKPATPSNISNISTIIREVIGKRWGKKNANIVRIQYGGSVNPKNINDFLLLDNIDGFLVGGASLEAKTFYKMIQAVAN